MKNLVCVGIRAQENRHNGALSTMRLLVGHDCVQLAAAKRRLVNAQVRPDVLRKHAPLPRMKPLRCVLPLLITAEMTLVLTLEHISVYVEEPLKRAARNRVSVQAYLLKKPQTLSRSGSLRPLNPIAG